MACYLPEGFRQITHSLFLCAMCYFKTDHNHLGEKIRTSSIYGQKCVKSDLSADLLLSFPPPFELKYYARTIGLRGNHDTAKNVSVCVKYFQSYKFNRFYEKKTTYWDLYLSLYQGQKTDDYCPSPPSPHQEGRGGTAESFNR